jgi:hypothetical protein
MFHTWPIAGLFDILGERLNKCRRVPVAISRCALTPKRRDRQRRFSAWTMIGVHSRGSQMERLFQCEGQAKANQ